MENIDINNQNNYIRNFFTSDSYVVKKSAMFPDIFEIYTTNDEGCLTLKINDNNIHVYYLSKCGEHTGTSLLEKIDELARSMPNINYIKLDDKSSIYINDYEIKLAVLKILTKGISWYNSLGYFSSNYENEKLHNEQLRNTPLIDILNSCKDKLIENLEEEYKPLKKQYTDTRQIDNYISKYKKEIDERISSLKSNLNTQFPSIKIDSNTKDYFNEIIKLIDTSEKAELLKELIEVVSTLILYDPKLYKNINRANSDLNKTGGKGKRRNKRKSKKSKGKQKQQKTNKQKKTKKMYKGIKGVEKIKLK
jgi:hypothetical protein